MKWKRKFSQDIRGKFNKFPGCKIQYVIAIHLMR